MNDKPVRIPGPDHPITIERNPARVTVRLAGALIADSRNALKLQEARYGAVQYVPRSDVDMTLLERTERSTYCPYKGDASYFSVRAAGSTADDAVWSYETPYDAVKSIAGHLAFYADRFEIAEEPVADQG